MPPDGHANAGARPDQTPEAARWRKAQGEAPGWFLPACQAGLLTLGLYLLLPWLEQLSAPTDRTVSLRPAHTVELPPPLPPPEPLPPPRQRHQPQPPKPRLRETRRQRTLQPPALRLDMPIGYVGGDFNVAFDINEAALSDQIHDLIFELGDLDEPPRPLTRLKPIYPPQARMRRLEGWVELEFVVLADGTVDDIQRVAEYPEALFTDSAIRAARQWRFIPGSKDGDAVAVRVRQKVTFKVE